MTRIWASAAVTSALLVALPNATAAEPTPQSSTSESSSAAPQAPTPPDSPAEAPPPETPPAETTPAEAPPATPAAEKPPEPAAPAKARSKKGLPRLHIEANRPGVRLLQINHVMSDEMGEGILVNDVCTAPCDKIINAKRGQTFFFGADGMVPSRGFKLSGVEGDVVARVDGGSLVARQVGYLVGGFGGVAVIGGITMLGVGYGTGTAHLSSEGKVVEGPNPNLTTGGFIVLGAGAAMVTTAIILVVTAKTKFTLVRGEDKSALVTWEMGAIRF